MRQRILSAFVVVFTLIAAQAAFAQPAPRQILNNAAAVLAGFRTHAGAERGAAEVATDAAAAAGGKLSDEHVKLLDDGRDARCTCAGAARAEGVRLGCTTRTGRTSAPQLVRSRNLARLAALRTRHRLAGGDGKRGRGHARRPHPRPPRRADGTMVATSSSPSSRWRRSRRGRRRLDPAGAGPGGEAAGIPAPGGSLAATTRTEKESFFDWARTKLRDEGRRAVAGDHPQAAGRPVGALEQAIEQAGGTRQGCWSSSTPSRRITGRWRRSSPCPDQFLARHKELRAGVEKNLIGKLIVPA